MCTSLQPHISSSPPHDNTIINIIISILIIAAIQSYTSCHRPPFVLHQLILLEAWRTGKPLSWAIDTTSRAAVGFEMPFVLILELVFAAAYFRATWAFEQSHPGSWVPLPMMLAATLAVVIGARAVFWVSNPSSSMPTTATSQKQHKNCMASFITR
jgi:hypothetical protein